jgi:predicted nucleic acid-binding Zn ribbon protein
MSASYWKPLPRNYRASKSVPAIAILPKLAYRCVPVSGEKPGQRRREWRQRNARQLNDLLPQFLAEIGGQYRSEGSEVAVAWPEVVGPQLAPMTRVVRYADGVLTISVAHSTLLGLLRQEKGRLVQKIRERCPMAPLNEIRFRLG